jgi:hypothetical protein
MFIFVDESESFVVPEDGSSLGVVGSLVITESQLPQFERRYLRLRSLLPKDDRGEVKGRLLAEGHVARVVDIVRRSGLLYEVSILDLPDDAASSVAQHRAEQCEGLTRTLTDEHHTKLVANLYALRQRLEEMPIQLYAQSVLTFDVLWRTLKHATAYYSQREPRALARFRWTFDAKSPNGVTDWEDWWSKVIKPFMQTQSFRDPFPELEGGDYSHFAAQETTPSKYLVERLPGLAGKQWFRSDALFSEIEFSANPLPGLEVVDVLTNAIRRALTGRLGPRGWAEISRVMIHRRAPTYLELMAFAKEDRIPDAATAAVLRRLGKGGRSMLLGT